MTKEGPTTCSRIRRARASLPASVSMAGEGVRVGQFKASRTLKETEDVRRPVKMGARAMRMRERTANDE